jgi:hypothetical protein
MTRNARFATIHWIRFPQIVTPDQLPLSSYPAACLSWKIGPDGPIGPDGNRLPSNIWCGVALFDERGSGESAFEAQEHLPALSTAIESWHALLVPVAHRGECNHLERTNPGLIFDTATQDPGGPLLVMTTAGFNRGPELDMERVIDFRVHVDRVHDWLKSVTARVASQVFTPHTVGDDGVTMSVWQSDAAMVAAMYRPGTHRTQIDRYKRETTADRTSFTRFRALRTSGQWGGADPIELARQATC